MPPKEYFWYVYAQLKPTDYDTLISKAKTRIISLRKLVRNNVQVTAEAMEVFKEFSDEDLDLLGKHNKYLTQKKLKSLGL